MKTFGNSALNLEGHTEHEMKNVAKGRRNHHKTLIEDIKTKARAEKKVEVLEKELAYTWAW